ncbi:MAG: hypothetical protein ACRD12_03900 [Acidimicrobiales bacterium]
MTTTTAPPAIVEVTSTTSASPGTTTATTLASASTGSRGLMPALTPASAGTYRYATSGTTRLGLITNPFPTVSKLVVDRPNGTRQRSVRDLRDPGGSGPVFESVLDYRRDGVYLVDLSVATTVLGVTRTQQLRPPSPVLFLPTDAGPGHHRQFEVEGTGITIDVVRNERVTIGTKPYETTVVRVAADALGEGAGHMELTVWLDPSTRLWVKERSVADAASPDGGFAFHSDYDATLLP